jgi:hypothetical protein
MPATRTRSTPEQMADKRRSLLALIEGAARQGHVCPSLGRLAALLRLSANRVHEMLHQLRSEKAITWKIVYGGAHATRVRVATITASGLKTAMPGMNAKQRAQPAKPAGPTFIGPPVRTLAGAEFRRRKAELEARDRDERARAQA